MKIIWRIIKCIVLFGFRMIIFIPAVAVIAAMHVGGEDEAADKLMCWLSK